MHLFLPVFGLKHTDKHFKFRFRKLTRQKDVILEFDQED